MPLFSDEELLFERSGSDDYTERTDEEVNEKYIKGDVRIVTEQARYPLSSITTMLETEDYNLNPEFQRRHRWDNAKKSRLMESFIMNVPIPPIFLYEDRFSHYEVMDGLQRLTAIYNFCKDKFALENLEEWPELNGRKYSELPDQVRRGIDRRYLSSVILLQETAKTESEAQRLKQLVFERINSGGVKLEPQEARNAIYNGNLNQLCIKLARNKFLCKCWGIPEPTMEELDTDVISDELLNNEYYRKMDDVELVLRFFAYRQRLTNQKGSLKDYLDRYLKLGNLYPAAVLEKLQDLFQKTIRLSFETFGEKAFWLYRVRNGNWSFYTRPTTVVYDPMMFVLSQRLDRSEDIANKAEEFQQKITTFYKDNYASFEGKVYKYKRHAEP